MLRDKMVVVDISDCGVGSEGLPLTLTLLEYFCINHGDHLFFFNLKLS